MNSYKARITLNKNIDDCIKLIDEIGVKYNWVREGNEVVKDHIHIWVLTDMKITQVRYKVSKVAGKGNEWFSITTCKEEHPYEYWRYMQKQNQIKWVRVEEDVKQQYEEWLVKTKEEIKRKKDEKVWELIMNIVIEKYSGRTIHDGADFDKELLDIVLEYHKDNKLIINKHRIFSYMDTIKINLPEDIYPRRYLWNDMKVGWLSSYNGKQYSITSYLK